MNPAGHRKDGAGTPTRTAADRAAADDGAENSADSTPVAAGNATRTAVIALLPGLLLSTVLLGPGALTNLVAILATAFALRAAARAFVARRAVEVSAPEGAHGQTLPWIGAIVLALTLPPASPAWVPALCALLLCAAGGALGTPRLPFNAAMAAAAFAFLVLPASLSAWPSQPVDPGGWVAQLEQAASIAPLRTTASSPTQAGPTQAGPTPPGRIGTSQALNTSRIDGSTGATALVAMAQRAPLTISEVRATNAAFGTLGAAGGEWIAIAWLAGALWLMQRRVLSWHVPLGCVAGVLLAAAAVYEGDGALGGSPPLLHLFAGGTLLVACFVLPEPGSRPHSHTGQLLYGLCAGVLLCALRESAGGADRAAAVVLLVNALAPAFDALAARMKRPVAAASQ